MRVIFHGAYHAKVAKAVLAKTEVSADFKSVFKKLFKSTLPLFLAGGFFFGAPQAKADMRSAEKAAKIQEDELAKLAKEMGYKNIKVQVALAKQGALGKVVYKILETTTGDYYIVTVTKAKGGEYANVSISKKVGSEGASLDLERFAERYYDALKDTVSQKAKAEYDKEVARLKGGTQ